MSISTIGNYTPVQTQPTQYFGTSSLSATASTTTATATSAGAAPDGSSFINAIASALSDSGVTSPATTSADTTSSDTSTDPAKALGDFLHTLMQSLHSQDGGQQQGTDGAPPAHAHGGGGGKGGHIKSDLQSLISSLGTSSTGDSTSTSTTSADGTTSTDSTTGADSTTSGLTASFKNLLGALGVDSADASSKLGQFLQTLSAKLDSSGPSGNLINTTA